MMWIHWHCFRIYYNLQFFLKWHNRTRHQNEWKLNLNHVSRCWLIYKILIWSRRNKRICAQLCDNKFNDWQKKISFIKVFIEVQSFIDYLRIWKCKCYTSIDIRFLFDDSRTNKLINKNKSCMFLDYDENIII